MSKEDCDTWYWIIYTMYPMPEEVDVATISVMDILHEYMISYD